MRKAIKTLMVTGRLAWLAFLVQLVAGFFADLPMVWGWAAIGVALGARFLAVRLAAAGPSRPPEEPVEVDPPVAGRWTALNSPASKVPSHGTRAYGQAYAIDIVADPQDRPRPRFAWSWPPVRRNAAFPAFGEPLLACADATVVRVSGGQRDHLSRNSLPALLYMFVESCFRELGAPAFLLGNHVVLDLGDGTFAVYAHLRRGSPTVRPGDRVRAGQHIADCGNSGNSTEPHLHFQLMDGPDPDTARAVPFTWRAVGVPANGETFSVPAPDDRVEEGRPYRA
ncbi:M23 family metallopeptidase [Actinomadura sp. NPDC047616]|uniref:M23 family metallopeptidase n=1 Tax=Actinomadura sp. NPDC047616 TaxID=3155914 RepID=UPI0033C3837C